MLFTLFYKVAQQGAGGLLGTGPRVQGLWAVNNYKQKGWSSRIYNWQSCLNEPQADMSLAQGNVSLSLLRAPLSLCDWHRCRNESPLLGLSGYGTLCSLLIQVVPYLHPPLSGMSKLGWMCWWIRSGKKQQKKRIAFNLSTQKAEAGESLSLRPTWATEQDCL